MLSWVEEAQRDGARLETICEVLELNVRTIQRWRARGGGGDRRQGPRTSPANKLSEVERARVLKAANSPEFRDKSPHQIVPLLADRGIYLASESTFYRVLREVNMLRHRNRAKPAEPRPISEHLATAPNQVWSWDITYLRRNIAGTFFYLYLFVDVWSRKIVAQRVFESECSTLASELLDHGLNTERLSGVKLVLHSDNGPPMKGSTLRATMDRLGIVSSFSRPRVSDDNPYSEALFRTLKYRPEYPHKPFTSREEAQAWVDGFSDWYNNEHLHSAIGFVTPSARHHGHDTAQLAARRRVYEAAKHRHPQRWSGAVRSWESPAEVYLNPSKLTRSRLEMEGGA